MRNAMAEAEVGDDVFLEDPTVNRLQEVVAAMLGHEAALFVPSGTMGNQIAIRCHTQPGDEMICEAGAHILHYELGGLAAWSGVHARTVVGARGVIALEQIAALIRPAVYYMPTTKLIALENTHNSAGGTIFPAEEITKIAAFAHERGLRLHLDGARLWNACAATKIAPKEYASACDSVSVCFSKGLGAPVGSALAGSREFIERARRVRKMLGGGMRQAGILAAAALYALEHNRERLVEDHRNAQELAEGLVALPHVRVERESVQTNIVMIDISQTKLEAATVVAKLRQEGVWVVPFGTHVLRAVTHLEISANDIEYALSAFQKVLA
ncbi:MAG: GntG family PLP-dependent aldolase [candidate division KSB1 bacterium]